MAPLSEFITYLETQVKNKSIYVWGAQGQMHPTLTEAWIKSKEKGTNRRNALKVYRAAVNAGKQKVCRAFDCSGLGMYWLIQNGVYKSDMTANGMKGKCTLINKSQLKKGDWVFRVYPNGKAYHIGYVVDDALNVVEARGRAYGVQKRTLNASGSDYWNAFGRPGCFASEINGASEPRVELKASRALTYVKGNLMEGKDVRALQLALNNAGVDCGSPDGVFGSNTYKAVKAYQKAKGLTVDGIVGKKTIEALGGTWIDSWTVVRTLRKGCEGEDVRNLQKKLIERGFSCGSKGADGDFGRSTENAVMSFQSKNKLAVDGIAGRNTIEALGGTYLA